jgi:hypothetical protein
MSLAGCTAAHSSSRTTTTSQRPRQTTVPLHPTTTTVPTQRATKARLDRFVALARHGLSTPFEASYRFVYRRSDTSRVVHSFRLWSEPPSASEREGDFVYESRVGSRTFRFVQNGRGDFECSRSTVAPAWRCTGPFEPESNGQVFTVEGFRLPLFVADSIVEGYAPPFHFFHRVVLGRQVWCLEVGPQPVGITCLARSGQVAYATGVFDLARRGLELVSLSAIPASLAALSITNAIRWKLPYLPPCEERVCTSPWL